MRNRIKERDHDHGHGDHDHSPYQCVYSALRSLTRDAMCHFDDVDDFPLTIGNAQAEALAKTLKAVTLKWIPKKKQAHYMNWLFSTLMTDCLKGRKDLVGRIYIAEKPKHKGKRAR